MRKNRNGICPNCRRKEKNCSCPSKKVNYKKLFLIAALLLMVFFAYFFVKGERQVNGKQPRNTLTTQRTGEYFKNPDEAYESLISFISDKSNGTYMVLLLNDRSKLNFSIAVGHGQDTKDQINKNISEQLKKLSWWFNKVSGDKLFLVEQAGLANHNEYDFRKITNQAYYEKILASDFLATVNNCRIRECDIRKNLFHEKEGIFINQTEYLEITKKSDYNLRNIVFNLEHDDYSLPVDELFPKILSDDYSIGFNEDKISKKDLYESLLFEQSSVLFEEECVKYMNDKKNIFSITGAMHAPYICENVLFMASSAEELEFIIKITNHNFVMRNLLNKINYNNNDCFKYKKICNQLRALYGNKVPIHYKNVF
ncbi:MAG TPA: hypothetical protein VFD16_02135 [Candidatus Saccharimonadales bacterium]|nr:hypothetical protein [Candidatus Saccharimonadales bacterium]